MEVMTVLIYVTFKNMNDVNTQVQVPAYEGLAPKKNTITKIAVGIVVILLISLAFVIFGGNTPNKTVKVVPATGATQEGGEVPAVGIIPPETPNSNLPVVAVCPTGEVMNEEKGECESVNKIPDAVGPVGEVKQPTQEVDYTKYLYPYSERGPIHGSYTTVWEEIEGNPLYVRIVSYKKGETFNFEVGYLDSNKKWVVFQRFESEKEEIWKNGPNYRYPGYFIRQSDPGYISYFDTGFTIYRDSPTFGIDGGVTYAICTKKGRDNCKSSIETAWCYIGESPETILMIE